MPDSIIPYLVGTWIACGILGFIVGEQKCAGGQGFALGLVFGPLGVIAALSLDGRPLCPMCIARLNRPVDRRKQSICPHCHAEIVWRRDSMGNRKPSLVGDAEIEKLNSEADDVRRRVAEARRTDEDGRRKLDALDAAAATAARPTSPEPPVIAPPPLPLPPKRPGSAPAATTSPAGRNPQPPRRA
jgi:hypothetical protein